MSSTLKLWAFHFFIFGFPSQVHQIQKYVRIGQFFIFDGPYQANCDRENSSIEPYADLFLI